MSTAHFPSHSPHWMHKFPLCSLASLASVLTRLSSLDNRVDRAVLGEAAGKDTAAGLRAAWQRVRRPLCQQTNSSSVVSGENAEGSTVTVSRAGFGYSSCGLKAGWAHRNISAAVPIASLLAVFLQWPGTGRHHTVQDRPMVLKAIGAAN